MTEPDKRTHVELYQEVLGSGWTPGNQMRTSYGMSVTFRKGFETSDYPGMESRVAHGKDVDDAMRKFLTELKE